jgi:uncharacterized protein
MELPSPPRVTPSSVARHPPTPAAARGDELAISIDLEEALRAEIAPAFRPTEARARVGLVDAVRGLAIFGILWVNVFLRSDPIQLSAVSQDRDGLTWLVALTGTLKFRSMFAFLFGLSLAMQAGRAKDEAGFVRIYLRRLGILLLFGVLHFALLWPGDILAMYALAGMLLVWLRRSGVRVLLPLASVFLLLAMVQQIVGLHLFDPQALRADVASAYPVYQAGTFWEVTQRRIYDYVTFWAPALWVTFPGVFAMMLFGVLFERARYLRAPELHLRLWRRLCWGGYLVGVPANLVYAGWVVAPARPAAFTLGAKVAHAVGAPALCIAYVATLVLLSRTGLGRRLLKPLEAVGRMSLTAYLGHSIVCSLLFYGYGLAWFGTLTKLQDVVLCGALFVGEVAFANLWFVYFRMGPLEWLWRWGTYGSRPAFRQDPRRSSAPALGGAEG